MRLITLPGVFSPHADTHLLAESVAEHVRPGDRVLDLCTGSGAIAVAAARHGAGRVLAVDVSRRALLTASINARLNGVRIETRRSDLFASLGDERFDLIAANPPYVPSVDGRVPARGASRAWDAGTDGRTYLDRICRAAARHLAPGGTVLMVHSDIVGVDRTLDLLSQARLRPRIAAHERGPLGALMSARARLLMSRGLLEPGRREEELVVISARAPESFMRPRAGSAGLREATDASLGPEAVTIIPYRDGPYLVRGPFVLQDQDGRRIEVDRKIVALCRCGRSGLRPLCDGTHKQIGFRAASGPEGAIPEAS